MPEKTKIYSYRPLFLLTVLKTLKIKLCIIKYFEEKNLSAFLLKSISNYCCIS